MKRLIIILGLIFMVTGSAFAQTATVNWNTTYQTVDGFGASSIFNGGLTNLSSNLNLFFSQSSGNGYSILRVGIPDGAGGGIPGDCSTVNSGCAGDISTMNSVIAINPAIRIFASSLSPPASMKSNGSTTCSGGSGNGALLAGSYGAYATWLANYVKSVQAQGITLYAISIQNEPDFCPNYDGALWSAANFDTFIKTNLGPTLASAGITVKVMFPETSQSGRLSSYADTTMTDGGAVGFVGLVATHDYAVSQQASPVNYTTGGKNFWETEVSDFQTFDPTMTSALIYAQEINNWMTQSNLNAWNFWWLVGLNGDNEGLIDNGTSVVAKRTYTIGNYAKFVRPGDVRVDCTSSPTSGVSLACFKTASTGAFKFIAINSNGSNVPLTISLNGLNTTSATPWVTSASLNLVQQSAISVSGSSFSTTLAATSVTTFVGTQSVAAACTGSGISWSCTAGVTPTQVQTAINAASANYVMTFAAGSYNWDTVIKFNITQGGTLICASVGACIVNDTVQGGDAVIAMSNFSGTDTLLYRTSGFTFNQNTVGSGQVIWWGDNCFPNCSGLFTQVRVDHNTFNLQPQAFAFTVGASNSSGGLTGQIYGVMDHNTATSVSSTVPAGLFREIGKLNPSPPANPMGTGNNFFIETNTLNFAGLDTTGTPCSDGWGTIGVVIRYNTYTNCLMAMHGVTHGGGPQNVEFYNNTGAVNSGAASSGFADGYRLFHHQGSGTFIDFNNTFTAFSGKSGEVISMLYYRDEQTVGEDGGALPPDAAICDGTVNAPADAPYVIDGNRLPLTTYRGYPCWHQPGRDFAANYVPMYSWNNKWSDTLAQVPLLMGDVDQGSPDYHAQHFVQNREWFEAVSNQAQTSTSSPFNGSSGMGFGTLANRPPTCTTSTETAFGAGAAGVGYFATDVGAQGTLYSCTATNVWSVYYVPYVYPHPLVSGGGGTPTVSWSQPSINFGNAPVAPAPSCPTYCASLTLTNVGSATLTFAAYNTSDPQFVIVTPGCPLAGGSLAPSTSCTDTIQFTPSSTGTKNATLSLSTNASVTPSVGLSGVGVPLVVTPPPPPAAPVLVGILTAQENER